MHSQWKIYIAVHDVAVRTEVSAITVSPWKFRTVIVIKIDKEMKT